MIDRIDNKISDPDHGGGKCGQIVHSPLQETRNSGKVSYLANTSFLPCEKQSNGMAHSGRLAS